MLNSYMKKFDAEKNLLTKRQHFELDLAIFLQLSLITGI